MPRKKEYKEDVVIEKALVLFWQNGYHNTSMQMLEKQMGINKFSIYSSFVSKHGVFIECLKIYKKKTKDIYLNFINSNNGIEDIKKLFYDSLNIWYLDGEQRGCLITNTYNEFADSNDELINEQLHERVNTKHIFIEKLKKDKSKSKKIILKEANFLLLALHGLGTVSKVSNKKSVEDFIEITFDKF